jgi:hypothetical protein
MLKYSVTSKRIQVLYIVILLMSVKFLSKKWVDLKGTWQRGGFSGVFAEIGTA